MLTAAERRELKARAHALHPLVMIGNEGLTPAVLKAVDEALKAHDLIKIRAAGEDRDAREVLLQAICEATGAAPVQHIGKVLIVWRERPPEPAAEPPMKAARPGRKRLVAARPVRTLSPSGAPARGTPGVDAASRPGRAPRLLPRRARPTRSGRR